MENTLAKGVYVAVLNEGSIRQELVHVINQMLGGGKYSLFVSYPCEKPIAYNRNKIVKDFLQNKNFDYLLMIDDDIIPPLAILNLADFQKDIIGALCFAYRHPHVIPLTLQRRGDGQYHAMELTGQEGLVECDAIGTGCIMISRQVLEHPWWRENGGWFRDEFDKEGQKYEGSDLAFCRKAQDLGFKIYSHLDYVCSHWVTMDLKTIYQSMYRAEAESKGSNKLTNLSL